jgi:hypothetical protein
MVSGLTQPRLFRTVPKMTHTAATAAMVDVPEIPKFMDISVKCDGVSGRFKRQESKRLFRLLSLFAEGKPYFQRYGSKIGWEEAILYDTVNAIDVF